jgi:uncharacterized protein YfcZ (UPF0381/DUF406 family)
MTHTNCRVSDVEGTSFTECGFIIKNADDAPLVWLTYETQAKAEEALRLFDKLIAQRRLTERASVVRRSAVLHNIHFTSIRDIAQASQMRKKRPFRDGLATDQIDRTATSVAATRAQRSMSIRYVASSVSEEEQSLTDIVANGNRAAIGSAFKLRRGLALNCSATSAPNSTHRSTANTCHSPGTPFSEC